jgi:prophage regulatory protein
LKYTFWEATSAFPIFHRFKERIFVSENCSIDKASGYLIRLSAVLERMPISKSTWWRGVKTGKYPQPVKLGEKITCWKLDDILKLVEQGAPSSKPH